MNDNFVNMHVESENTALKKPGEECMKEAREVDDDNVSPSNGNQVNNNAVRSKQVEADVSPKEMDVGTKNRHMEENNGKASSLGGMDAEVLNTGKEISVDDSSKGTFSVFHNTQKSVSQNTFPVFVFGKDHGQSSSQDQGHESFDSSQKWSHPFFMNKTPSTTKNTFSQKSPLIHTNTSQIHSSERLPISNPTLSKANTDATTKSTPSTQPTITIPDVKKPAFCITIPEFEGEDWNLSQEASQEEHCHSQELVPIYYFLSTVDNKSETSRSSLSIVEGEENSDDEELKSYAQLWEHTKKRLPMTIIKEKMVKISVEESAIKKIRREEVLKQQNQANEFMGEDTDMSDAVTEDGRYFAIVEQTSEGSVGLIDDLYNGMGRSHAHQVKDNKYMQEQGKRQVAVLKKLSYGT